MRKERQCGGEGRRGHRSARKRPAAKVSGNPPLKSRQHTQAGQMRYDVNTAFAGEADDPGRSRQESLRPRRRLPRLPPPAMRRQAASMRAAAGAECRLQTACNGKRGPPAAHARMPRPSERAEHRATVGRRMTRPKPDHSSTSFCCNSAKTSFRGCRSPPC